MRDRAKAPRISTFRWQIGLTLLAAAIVYLVGNESVCLWDRDEPRYAQTSRQMLQSGDWVVPRFLGDVRTAKPVFIYWCQAIAMKLFGDTAFAARLPSVVAMLGTLTFVTIMLLREIGRTRTVLTVFILGSAALSIACAKMCVTDAVLLLWITIAQACLFEIVYRRGRWRSWVAIGVAIGCAGLTKGPVVLGVMGTTIGVLMVLSWIDRRLRRRRSGSASNLTCDAASGGFSFGKLFVALAIVLVICGPWLILIHQRAPEFLPRIIGHDIVTRVKAGLEGHAQPPGYYLLTIWGTFFPWSLFIPAAMVYGWRHRRDPLTRFALAGVIGPWLMFEVVQTKLVHYVLPTFPPLALLTARAIAQEARKLRCKGKQARDRAEAAFLIVLGSWCAGIVLASLALPVFTLLRYSSNLMMILSAIGVSLIGAEMAGATFVAWRARRPMYAAAAMGAGMFAIVGVTYALWLPQVDALRISQRVASVLAENGATRVGDVIMISYKEPSLAFYQGGTIREEPNGRYLTETDPLTWPRWIVLTERLWHEQPPRVRERLQIVGAIDGWWYSNRGQRVTVMVAQKK